MSDDSNPDTEGNSDQTSSPEDASRRNFLTTSTGTVAVASALAAGAGAALLSTQANAAWPTSSDAPDLSKIGAEAFDVAYLQLAKFRIESDQKSHCNLDGEPVRKKKLKFSVLNRRLRVAF